MGYRLTYYKCPKAHADKYRNITNEDFSNDDFVYPSDGLEEMFYDITNWIWFEEFQNLSTNNEEDKIWSRLFTNKLEIEDDISLMTIDKEQMFNLINMIRRFILSKNKRINIRNFDKEFESPVGKDESKIYKDTREILCNHTFDVDVFNIYYNVNNDEEFLKVLNEHPYSVCFGTSWRDTLNNFIHVYKTFDWENNYIIVYGG
jgi:hypothetical protein